MLTFSLHNSQFNNFLGFSRKNLSLAQFIPEICNIIIIKILGYFWGVTEVLAFSSNRILCIQIEGLIPFKSSIDQGIASLYFLRISNSFCSSSSVNSAEMMTGLVFSGCKKAYLK